MRGLFAASLASHSARSARTDRRAGPFRVLFGATFKFSLIITFAFFAMSMYMGLTPLPVPAEVSDGDAEFRFSGSLGGNYSLWRIGAVFVRLHVAGYAHTVLRDPAEILDEEGEDGLLDSPNMEAMERALDVWLTAMRCNDAGLQVLAAKVIQLAKGTDQEAATLMVNELGEDFAGRYDVEDYQSATDFREDLAEEGGTRRECLVELPREMRDLLRFVYKGER